MGKQSQNIVHFLQQRECGFQFTLSHSLSLHKIAEKKAASSEMEEIHCKLPSSVRSTFLMSFSPDCSKVASTHGDHKIYVCDVKTGKLLHKLEGHPRTPWCVVFHPISNDILASGCLGGEVRVWDLHGGSEQWRAEQNTVITSLTFHPFDKVLVISTYNRIHFWNWNFAQPFATCSSNSIREKVRFVKFNRLGTKLITGILNQPETTSESGEDRLSQSLLMDMPTESGVRRSLWTRLMNMYQNIDGSEEDEALERARRYADAVTQVSRFQRQLSTLGLSSNTASTSQSHSQSSSNIVPGSNSTSGISNSNNNNATNNSNGIVNESNSDVREISESHEEFLVRAFWRTFNRLRTICSALERRMHQLQRNSENEDASSSSSSSTSNSPDSLNESAQNDTSNNRTGTGNATSEQLVNILTRLQNSLQFSAIAESVPPEQIQQLQGRISEILERLTNVTGYRARLTTLRDHIFEVAERSEHRMEGSSPISRQDLGHCLFLVEMSLQLTRQMQRILQADYRLIRSHLTNSNTSQPSPLRRPDSPSNAPHSNLASCMCALCGHRGLTTILNEERQSHSDRIRDVTRRLREVRREIHQRRVRRQAFYRIESETMRSELQQENSELETDTSSPPLLSDLASPRPTINSIPDSSSTDSIFGHSSSESSDSSGDEILISPVVDLTAPSRRVVSVGLQQLHPINSRASATLPSSADNGSRFTTFRPYIRSGLSVGSTTTGPPNSNNQIDPLPPNMRQSTSRVDNDATRRSVRRRIPLYIPDLPIDLSPSADEQVSVPPPERPRSPPLPTILSAGNDFSIWQFEPYFSSWHPYFSQAFYEASRRSQFGGSHDSNNSNIHRIQCWDFSNYKIPDIMNAKANVVVSKCKIHNDASVSISQDGEILAALVPSSVSDLVTFAIYSLKPEMLGTCLYKSQYEGNAISVSLSPFNYYVVVGVTPPRLGWSSSEKEAVAHIYKLKIINEKEWNGYNVRSLSQQSSLGNQVSLNSVQWLPQSGQGLIYGTNKGCLCICKPIAPMPPNKSKGKIFKFFRPDSDHFSSTRRRMPFTAQLMLSTSTQTVEPTTQTTGTQTFVTNGNSTVP